MSPQLQEQGQPQYIGILCIRQAGTFDSRITMFSMKQRTDQCTFYTITEPISSLQWHSSNCLSLFSFACMNKMKQSRGININAIITALKATQNHDNSRRLASRKKKKILITLAPAFFPNGRHAAACHFSSQSVQTYLYHRPPFLYGRYIERGGSDLAALRVRDGCDENHVFFLCSVLLCCEGSALPQEPELQS